MPRWLDADKVTFKYGLGTEFIDVLKALHKVGLDRTEPVSVKGVQVSPRDVVAACLPDPATLGDAMAGKTCAGLLVTGNRQSTGSRARSTCPTSSTTPTRCGSTARSAWCGRRRSTPSSPSSCWPPASGRAPASSGPRRSTPCPFLDLLASPDGYDSPWELHELTPGASPRRPVTPLRPCCPSVDNRYA